MYLPKSLICLVFQLKRESQELDELIEQAEVEIECEQGVTHQLVRELDQARLGGGQLGVDEDSIEAMMARQVQSLQAENTELLHELAQSQQSTAKQKDIHAAVGEMSSAPLQVCRILVSVATTCTAELTC